MEPEVRYCTTTDGVRIAYTVTGEGAPLLVMVDAVVSHVQLEWSVPSSREIQTELSRQNTLIRFDPRGAGLSDRVLATSLDDMLLDIEAVVERTGFRELALCAMQTSAAPAIAFAARHPESVTRMSLINGFARVRDMLESDQVRGLLSLAQTNWEMATELIGFITFGAGRDENRDYGKFVRACIGPESLAPEAVGALSEVDVSDLAAAVEAPTLVIKLTGTQFVTIEMVKDLVARMPNAQLTVIDETWADNPTALARRIAAFVNGETAPADSRGAMATIPTGTAVILFADIVESTALTERLGDAAFRAKARDLDGALRSAISGAGGTPVKGKLLGDGVLAVFTSARQAIEAALVCGHAGNDGGLPLHLGIHAGDVIEEDGNVFGGAVNIAARIAGESAAGEVLVSGTVRELARTSAGVTFEDAGERTLKGVSDAVSVWRVVPGDITSA